MHVLHVGFGSDPDIVAQFERAVVEVRRGALSADGGEVGFRGDVDLEGAPGVFAGARGVDGELCEALGKRCAGEEVGIAADEIEQSVAGEFGSEGWRRRRWSCCALAACENDAARYEEKRSHRIT